MTHLFFFRINMLLPKKKVGGQEFRPLRLEKLTAPVDHIYKVVIPLRYVISESRSFLYIERECI